MSGPPAFPFARFRAVDLAASHADGQAVTDWPDVSGNGHDLSSVNTTDPEFRLFGFAGGPHPYVAFPTGSDRMASASFPGGALAQPLTWVFIGEFIEISGTPILLDDAGASQVALFIQSDNWARFAGTVNAVAVQPAVDTPYVVAAAFDDGGTGGYTWLDGAEIDTGTAGGNTLAAIAVGQRADGANDSDCRFAEILLYDRVLSDVELAQLWDYHLATYLSSHRLDPALVDDEAPLLISAGGPSQVTLTPAATDLRAVALDTQPGVVTAPLTPAQADLDAVPLAATPGPVTVAVVPGQLDLQAIAVDAVAGAVDLAFTPAALDLVAVAVAAQPGGVTTSLTPAQLDLLAVVVLFGEQVTPAERTLAVPAEERTLTVAAEERTLTAQ